MEKSKFITEEPKTRITRSHGEWMGETLIKIKGYCYEIITSKGRGGIRSYAMKVNDAGTSGSMYCVSFSMSDMEKTIELGSEKAIATEAKVKALHMAALAKFQANTDELPSKDEAYKIEVGQVVFMNDSGQNVSYDKRLIIYKLDEFDYYTVNETNLQITHDSLSYLRDIEHKSGIGKYYKKGDVVSPEFAAELLEKALAKAQADEDARPAREAAAKAERDAQIAEIEQSYPYLQKPSRNSGGGKHVAVNLRIELKRLFPEVKFSITSSYSSCDIRWTDGPTKNQVKEISSKYEDHVTDSSGDFRDYSPDLFNEVFGGCNYVFEDRSMSDETEAIIAALVKENHKTNEFGTEREELNRIFYQLEIPSTPFSIVRDQENHKWKAITEQPDETEPMHAEPIDNAGIVVRKNEEKNGIEISFSSKPDDTIIELLKMTGFRWSRFSKVWWVKHTDELWDFANNLTAIMAE
jgi:hypothetical protein